jgi:predicted kinase
MATAHLIHGFLGVGKTTLARRLEQMIPAIRFSHDE